MNDKNKDKDLQQINLEIGGIILTGRVKREDEATARQARLDVNQRIRLWRDRWPEDPKEKVLAVVAFEFATECLRNEKRNDTEPYAIEIKKLTDLLEDYLKKE